MSPRAVQDDLSHPAPIGTFPLSWYGDILIKFRQLKKIRLQKRPERGKLSPNYARRHHQMPELQVHRLRRSVPRGLLL